MLQHNLFSVLQERGQLIDAMMQDRQIVNVKRLESLNRRLPRHYRARDLQTSLIEQLSSNLPSFTIHYRLIDNPKSTRLKSGHDMRQVIGHGMALRSSPGYRSRSDACCRDVPRKLTHKLTGSLQRHFAEIARGEKKNSGGDPGLTLEQAARERDSWTGIKRLVGEWVTAYLKETVQRIPERYTGMLKENRRIIDRMLTLGFRCAEQGIDRITGKQLLYSLMMHILYPAPESGFATDEDAYNLFRTTFLNTQSMQFGIGKQLTGGRGLELGIFSHQHLNGLGAIEQLKGCQTETLHTGGIEDMVHCFCERTGQREVHDHLHLFAVPAQEYRLHRGEWFRQLMYRIGRVTTVKSLYEDRSLFLTRSEYNHRAPQLRQSIRMGNVNEDLRRLITLARLTDSSGSVMSSYREMAPVVRRYLRLIFDDNVGMLTSDLSQIAHADGFVVLPPVLPDCSYPLIVISSSGLDRSTAFNPSDRWSIISVRTDKYSCIEKVMEAITHVFSERCLVLYPRVPTGASGNVIHSRSDRPSAVEAPITALLQRSSS